jgi:hypothetical protein
MARRDRDRREPVAHGKLAGILQKIAEGLCEAVAIRVNEQRIRRACKLEADSGSFELRPVVFDGAADELAELEPFRPQLKLVPGDSGDVEQVIDQA